MPRGRKRKSRLGAIVRSGKARRGEASGDDESDSSLSDLDDRTPHRPVSDAPRLVEFGTARVVRVKDWGELFDNPFHKNIVSYSIVKHLHITP